MGIEHWMVFGTFAEQRYFIYPHKDIYRGVIFNANMVSHAPDGLAAFLLERTDKLPYLIDPLTHAFQHDPFAITNSKGDVKSSISGLADAYGEPIKSIAGKRPLLPRDFSDTKMLEQFVKNCLDFQKGKLSSAMEKSDTIKYFTDLSQAELRPQSLICPYFYMTEASIERWLEINILATEMSTKYIDSNKLFAEIVVSQGVIASEDSRNQIVEAYSDIDLDGYIIWVDDLDEHKAGSADLEGLVRLSRGLRKNNEREVINLHGGYFSVLSAGKIGNAALTGVAHGPEFGEHRPVIPVGGGIPIARYYIHKLHERVKYRDAIRILREKGWLSDASTFHQKVCQCEECRNVVNGVIGNFTLFGESTAKSVRRGSGIVTMEFPTSAAKERCLKHYLQIKSLEYKFAANASNDQILQDLEEGIDQYEDIVGLEGVSHLELWKSILSN